jgi:uncharacterized protein YbcI
MASKDMAGMYLKRTYRPFFLRPKNRGKKRMENEEKLIVEIVLAVESFENEQMSIRPNAICANFLPNLLVVLLSGITYPAEKHCARDSAGRDLLEKIFLALFNVAKQALEYRIGGIIKCKILKSMFTVDIELGSAVIVFFLSENLKTVDS